MRKPLLSVLAVAATAGALTLGLALGPATAAPGTPQPDRHRTLTIKAVETGTAINMVDVAPADSALGDQLIGTGDLTTPAGRALGTSSFVGVSTDARPRTAELLTFVYELPDGKITTSGTATLSATGPVFDERFAVTGGTGAYRDATGQVRVVQETVERAKVTFTIQH
ncbi:allene oxide cyclase barrel-like domain-containing protein [Streptomyces scabiei]|uniref:allene oxide cyclase barrel-like domain-containing protein n=1 Tax=Streptomyces scabiei TaxID=1930 RepID=UPI0038F71582